MNSLRSFIALLPLLLALLASGSARGEEKKEAETKRAHSMRAETFKEIEKAQQASEAKNYAGARAILEGMLKGNLTEYEKATVWSLLAAVHFDQDDYPGAIAAFRQVVAQQDIPEGMRIQTMTNLAQLLLANEQYRESIATLKELYGLVESPTPDMVSLEAQAHFQLKDYPTAVSRLLDTLRIAKQQQLKFKEMWLALLRASYYELGDNEKAVKVLEILVSLYPKKEYWIQLAGLYGILNREKDQLAAMEAAYEQGLLDREQEYVSLAQLLMVQGVPYKGWRVLERGIKEGFVKEKLETLRLLSQAMVMAQESEKQIPVLEKAAKMAPDGEMDLYLGQAWMEKNDWGKAAESLSTAIRKGVKRPGAAYLLLGTVRFNQGKFDEARSAFGKAAKDPDSAESAGQWIKYVEVEQQRREYLAAASADDP